MKIHLPAFLQKPHALHSSRTLNVLSHKADAAWVELQLTRYDNKPTFSAYCKYTYAAGAFWTRCAALPATGAVHAGLGTASGRDRVLGAGVIDFAIGATTGLAMGVAGVLGAAAGTAYGFRRWLLATEKEHLSGSMLTQARLTGYEAMGLVGRVGLCIGAAASVLGSCITAGVKKLTEVVGGAIFVLLGAPGFFWVANSQPAQPYMIGDARDSDNQHDRQFKRHAEDLVEELRLIDEASKEFPKSIPHGVALLDPGNLVASSPLGRQSIARILGGIPSEERAPLVSGFRRAQAPRYYNNASFPGGTFGIRRAYTRGIQTQP